MTCPYLPARRRHPWAVLPLTLLTALFLLTVLAAPACAASEAPSDWADVDHPRAVSVLLALEVMETDETGAFRPEDAMTRGELALLLERCLGNTEPAGAECPFPDVTDPEMAAAVALCSRLGIAAGRGDGLFHPDDPVTGHEAAKMVLCALGYDAQAEGLVGRSWDLNTSMLAVTAGILRGVQISAAPLTREEAAQLVCTALQAGTVTYGEDGALTTGPSLLSGRFGYGVAEGTARIDGDALVLSDVTVDGQSVPGAEGAYPYENIPAEAEGARVALFIRFADPEAPAPEDAQVLPGSLALLDEGGNELFPG